MKWKAYKVSRRDKISLRYLTLLGLLIFSAFSWETSAQVITPDAALTPEFKRLDKGHWKRWEKDKAKSFRKTMKRRELADCPDVNVFQAPPQPYYALKPYFPVLAEESGECTVRFNINRKGYPTHLVPNCSSELYIGSAEQTVSQWWFKSLRDSEGGKTRFCGYEVKFKFSLED